MKYFVTRTGFEESSRALHQNMHAGNEYILGNYITLKLSHLYSVIYRRIKTFIVDLDSFRYRQNSIQAFTQ